MKIAIHHRKGSFSDRWIAYCEENNISFKVVDCYANDIIEQIKDCDALMWHHDNVLYTDILFAKQLLFSIQHSGKVVFPDFKTGWHFDDKVGQKYLLEGLKVPIISSYVFYDEISALNWAKQTSFPKVSKLRGGSGSSNVKLVKNYNSARKYIKRAFRNGISQFSKWNYIKEKLWHLKSGKDSFFSVLTKILYRVFVIPIYYRNINNEKNYVYFQDFIQNNSYDIRVIVIGDKAFALKRMVRENDFRASGSGKIVYEKDQIDLRCVELAFLVNVKLKSQSVAFDFVFESNNNPLLVEISYGFAVAAYDSCPGYWDSELNWFEGSFNPQNWMIENLIKQGVKNKV